MDNFDKAYEPLKKNEGGYVNNPSDKGGETYGGISRKWNPEWEGWSVLDVTPNKKTNQKFPTLSESVKAFFKKKYWLGNNLDKVPNLEVVTALLDTVANHGTGGKLIQMSLQNLGVPVDVDGRIGPGTITGINKSNPSMLLRALHDQREKLYFSLVKSDPSQAQFLKGWLARIAKYKSAGVVGGSFASLVLLGAAAFFVLKRFKS